MSSNRSISSIQVKIHMPYFLIQVSSRPLLNLHISSFYPDFPATSSWSTSLRAGTWLSSQERSTSTCWKEKEWNWTNWERESQVRWLITQCPTWEHKPLLRDRSLESESEWMESCSISEPVRTAPLHLAMGLTQSQLLAKTMWSRPVVFCTDSLHRVRELPPLLRCHIYPDKKSCWHTPRCHGLGLDV